MMTSAQISAIPANTPELIILRELAVQLAVMNERTPQSKPLVWNNATQTWDQL